MWVFYLLMALASADAQSKCNIPGLCLGDHLNFTVTDTAEQCLEFCHDTQGCQWYTHDSSNDFCTAFRDCPEMDTSCGTCSSGQSTCKPPQCFVPGLCQGKMLSLTEAVSEEECLKKCQETKDSAWFTFHFIDHHCMILEDCDLVQGDGYSVSGERNCTVQVPEYSKIVIQHGTNVDWITVPAVGDYSDVNKCSPLPDYPESIQGSMDAVIDGRVVICGGNSTLATDAASTSRCYVLSRDLNLWLEFESMNEQRAYAASAWTSNGWWVTGGRAPTYEVFPTHAKLTGPSSLILSSTEIYNTTAKQWIPGPSLPSERHVHCIIRINSALSFFTGGHSNIESFSNDTWIYSWPDDLWTELPVMPVSRRDMACDVYTDMEGVRHIMVVGGDGSLVRVDSFNLVTNSWQPLPDLPSPADNGATLVQDGDNIFLVNPFFNNVMRLNKGSLTFEVINGQGTGVTGFHTAVIPVNDENLHGC